MTSQEENSAPFSESQPPPMDSEKLNTEVAVKLFSIRQYAFSWRQKNMLNSWPFSENSMQMCVTEGVIINDVLPPFDGEPLHGSSNLLHYLQDDHSNDVSVCKAGVPHQIEYEPAEDALLCVNESNNNPTLTTAMRGKHKRGRRRSKKRSMADILAEARHRTLEEY